MQYISHLFIHSIYLSSTNSNNIIKSERRKNSFFCCPGLQKQSNYFFRVYCQRRPILQLDLYDETCIRRQIQLYLFIFKKKAAKNVQLQFCVHCIVNISITKYKILYTWCIKTHKIHDEMQVKSSTLKIFIKDAGKKNYVKVT